ncbi:uncharacterized protein LOC142238237 [Haematobia irritans]|uniref:uncharacterized protein LOC142238237 n=1 Tax=Haematobia irritans TaxID=7368 RepID=UPI003F4FFDEC
MSTVFQGKFLENLKFGHLLEIGTKATENGSWFNISLATAKFNEGDFVDIGLRVSVYLKENLIVFKRQKHGEWLKPMSQEFPTNIFRKQFKIIFVMDEKCFHIAINDIKLITVDYIFDIEKLTIVKITGDLFAIKLMNHRKYFPIPWPPVQYFDDRLNFSHDVPGSFRPGHIMVITMKLWGKLKGRFHMHFRNAKNCKRQEVHISVRFDSKTIVRTSKLPAIDVIGDESVEKMEYGPEECDGIFPFDIFPMTFKFAFGFTENSLRLAKDGVHLFDFRFRTPKVLPDLAGITILGLQGMIVNVRYIDHIQGEDPLCQEYERYSEM